MSKKVFSEQAPAAIGPYSQGIEVEGYVYVSGQLPVNTAKNELEGGIQKQTDRCLQNIRSVLAAAGLAMEDIVKTTVFMTDLGQFQTMNEVYSGYFKEPFPARSTVQITALPRGASIEIECIAKCKKSE
jgi:2-iminobutanoate/2-iminopropanoate deaminase